MGQSYFESLKLAQKETASKYHELSMNLLTFDVLNYAFLGEQFDPYLCLWGIQQSTMPEVYANFCCQVSWILKTCLVYGCNLIFQTI